MASGGQQEGGCGRVKGFGYRWVPVEAEKLYPEPKAQKKKLDSMEQNKGALVGSVSLSIKEPRLGTNVP